MIQKGLIVGLLEVNCYILGDEDTREAVVIDPGGDEDAILEVLNYNKFQLKLIIDTHGHFDHSSGVNEIVLANENALVIAQFEYAFSLFYPFTNTASHQGQVPQIGFSDAVQLAGVP